MAERKDKQEEFVRRLLERIERGSITIIERINSTLRIDSNTNPTKEQIDTFVRTRIKQRRNHGRKS